MYTGNDDNIVVDLLTTYTFTVGNEKVSVEFKGGLLGHWAVWTSKAVELLNDIKQYKSSPNQGNLDRLLTKGAAITDANAAIFDSAHNFKGCIPGIHDVLRRQALLKGIWCLNPNEMLSPGQEGEIDRVCRDYPELNDDRFTSEFLANQMSKKL